MHKDIKEKLIKKAKEARKNSHSIYSSFKVGAALLTDTGEIFTGCNIENSSYSLTICAERTAIFKAVSEGYHKIKALVIISDSKRPITPCGACRQVISEFADNPLIIMVNLQGRIKEVNFNKLFPEPFNKEDIDDRI